MSTDVLVALPRPSLTRIKITRVRIKGTAVVKDERFADKVLDADQATALTHISPTAGLLITELPD